MKPQLVTTDAIIEAMRAAVMPTTGGDPGLTTEEWSVHLGISDREVLRRFRLLQTAGRLVVGHQRRPALDGRIRQFTVYRVT